jgi:hypothetical protein
MKKKKYLQRALSASKGQLVAVCLLLSVTLVAIHFFVNTIWLLMDRTPFLWDAQHYYIRSLEYHLAIKNLNAQRFLNLLSAEKYHPPLMQIQASLTFLLTGTGKLNAALFVSTLWFGISILATFLLGLRMHGPAVGLIAALSLGLLPILYGLSRTFFLDLPMVALVPLAFVILRPSLLLRSAYGPLAAALIVTIGMHYRETFLVYVLPLLALNALTIFKAAPSCRKIQTTRFVSFLILTALLCAPFYLNHFLERISLILNEVLFQGHRADLPTGISLESLFYYPRAIMRGSSPILSLFLIVGILRSAFSAKGRLLIYYSVFIYLIFTIVSLKNIRLIVPLLPILCVGAALGWRELVVQKRLLGSATICLVFLFGTSQLLASSFLTCYSAGESYYLAQDDLAPACHKDSWAIEKLQYQADFLEGARRPIQETGWSQKAALIGILTSAPTSAKGIQLFSLSEHPFIFELQSSALEVGLNLSILTPPYHDLNLILQSDFILEQIGGFRGPIYNLHKTAAASLLFKNNQSLFELIHENKISPEMELRLFRNKSIIATRKVRLD